MDEAGVGCAVLVQCMTAYSDDNRYVVDCANAQPERFRSIVYVDPTDDPVVALDRWVEQGASGVRLVGGTPNRPLTVDSATAIALLDHADRRGLEVVLTLGADQLPRLRAVMAERPHLRAALDHCGFVDVSDGRPYPAARALLDLVEFPHLVCKVSTIMLNRAARADGGDPRPFVEHLAAHFGADRLMWASNYSETATRSYVEVVELALRACSGLSTAQQLQFLGETALSRVPFA
jgi:predicted TIM-barrel fold metal-dependent hydrolase